MKMELEIRYEPLHEDYVKFVEHTARFKAIFAEFRSGKTTFAGLLTLKVLAEHPGLRAVVVRNLRGDLYDSTIPQFKKLYDWDAYGGEYSYTRRELTLPNGSILAFRALDRPVDVKKLKNIEIGWFWIDQAEEIQESIWQMLEGRLSQEGMPNGGIATGNPEGKNWVFYKFFQKPLDVRTGTFKGVEREYGLYTGQSEDYLGLWPAPFLNEQNLPPGYYSHLIEANPRDWVDKYVFGKWTGYEGRVYPSFSEAALIETTPYDYVGPQWRWIEAMDYGMAAPTVWLWLAYDLAHDVIDVVDEYYVAGAVPATHAKAIRAKQAFWGVQPILTVGCPRAFQTERDGFTPADEYLARHGIKISRYDVGLETRWAYLETRFEQGRIRISRRCENLIRELQGYTWQNMKNLPNHAIEALERGVARIEEMTMASRAAKAIQTEARPHRRAPAGSGVLTVGW